MLTVILGIRSVAPERTSTHAHRDSRRHIHGAGEEEGNEHGEERVQLMHGCERHQAGSIQEPCKHQGQNYAQASRAESQEPYSTEGRSPACKHRGRNILKGL